MGFRVKILRPTDAPDSFPNPALAGIALGQPDGLVAIGGDLSPARLMAAYRKGIFPWFNEDQPILWWSPQPRAVIFPARFHMSRSLIRNLKRGGWQYSLNTLFNDVIHLCASNRGKHGTWITREMILAYSRLHELGFAHSVESWRDGHLAGGIYGIRLGSVFFGESMFSKCTDGSKVALSALVQICIEAGISVIDCQLESEHLRTLGMEQLSRQDFLGILESGAQDAEALADWTFPARDAAELLVSRAANIP